MTNTPLNPNELPVEELQLDVKKWFYKLLSYWWLFALAFGASVSVGYLYLRYSVYEHETTATLLIKTNNSGDLSAQQILLQDQGVFNQGKVMINEITILKSYSLIEEVVNRLDLHIQYYRIGNVKQRELYGEKRFFEIDTFSLRELDRVTFDLEVVDQDHFELRLPDSEVNPLFQFGVPFEIQAGYFNLVKLDSFDIVGGKTSFQLRIRRPETMADIYRNRLSVQQVGDHFSSGILELSIQGPVPKKSEDFINTLIEVYNEAEIRDENTILRNTLTFIDERLISLEGELQSLEGGIEAFKERNAIAAESATTNSSVVLERRGTLEKELADLEVEAAIMGSLGGLFTGDKEDLKLIPANLITDNPALISNIDQYNDFWLARNRLLSNGTPRQNPRVIELTSQLSNLREIVLESVDKTYQNLQAAINKTKEQITKAEQSIRSVPGQERRLLDQKRQQVLKENLYIFLLQKREETALSEAVTTAKTRIIDAARSSRNPVSPRPNIIYLICVLSGLFVPLGIILLREYWNENIESEDQIRKRTTIPILGEIGMYKGKDKLIVSSTSRSAITEMFRLLRTNLNFLNANNSSHTIMVTSSTGGEGKTFITINLGLTIALSRKKVVIIGLDLRKPKLSKYLDVDSNQPGITDYLIGEVDLAAIYHPLPGHDQMFYITSGPVPPNPAELILSERTTILMEYLRQHFDYILIDTPPVGLVTDALLLNEYVDTCLIVTRMKYTKLGMLDMLEQLHVKERLKNPFIIFNAVSKARGYRYGYGYGYSYGYYEK